MAESAEDNALYWVEPEIRGVIPLDRFHVPRSLARVIRSQEFSVTVDTDFEAVMEGCAGAAAGTRLRNVVDRPSTWINTRIRALYSQLHAMGFCHSIECRDHDGELVGGLYGVKIGAAFFGESMFSARRDASKVALVHLVARLNAGGFKLLDTQFVTDHLKQFGCIEMPRDHYLNVLEEALLAQADFTLYDADHDGDNVLSHARKMITNA